MRYGYNEQDSYGRFDGGQPHGGGGRRGGGRGRRGGGGGFGSRGGMGSGRDGGRGGRGRARRGEIRAAVLALLLERPMHGYEMIKEIEERTNGLWKPSPGSVYPTLAMLEDEDHVTVDEQSGKRLFTLTESGREIATAGDDAPWDAVVEGISSVDQSLRQVARQIMIAAKQVAEAGDATAKTRAVEVLTETRKKLYAILAETD